MIERPENKEIPETGYSDVINNMLLMASDRKYKRLHLITAPWDHDWRYLQERELAINLFIEQILNEQITSKEKSNEEKSSDQVVKEFIDKFNEEENSKTSEYKDRKRQFKTSKDIFNIINDIKNKGNKNEKYKEVKHYKLNNMMSKKIEKIKNEYTEIGINSNKILKNKEDPEDRKDLLERDFEQLCKPLINRQYVGEQDKTIIKWLIIITELLNEWVSRMSFAEDIYRTLHDE